jgi:hypothetical protein
MPAKQPIKQNSAEALVSLLIAIVLFAILGNALFTLVSSSYRLVSFTSSRLTARQIGLEKIETIRNLPYDNVGTVGGIPAGIIQPLENVTKNKLKYIVTTNIIYIDDPLDQLAPDDTLPTDYKKVEVNVTWEGLAGSSRNPVSFVTNISPKGVESTAGGGTLSILVFDANAQPVAVADVHIVASSVSPQVDTIIQTGVNGRVILPGASPCIACYEITISKSGYSTEQTYSTVQVANPNKPHATVINGQLTEVSFAIDVTSTLNLSSLADRESGFTPLGNITFDIRGEKTIGTDTNDAPVYKYTDNLTTDSGGSISITGLEWDNYIITMPSGSTWDMSGTNPLLPLLLGPNSSIDFSFALTGSSPNSLLATFLDLADSRISSVSGRLYDDTGFEATGSSGLENDPDYGQIFFSGLTNQFYHFTATESSYLDINQDVDVSGYTTETLILTPN